MRPREMVLLFWRRSWKSGCHYVEHLVLVGVPACGCHRFAQAAGSHADEGPAAEQPKAVEVELLPYEGRLYLDRVPGGGFRLTDVVTHDYADLTDGEWQLVAAAVSAA